MRTAIKWIVSSMLMLAHHVVLSANPGVRPEAGTVQIVPMAQLPSDVRQLVEADAAKPTLPLEESGAVVFVRKISAETLAYLKSYQGRARTLEEVRMHSKSPLVDIEHGDLAGCRLEGVIPEGPDRSGPWSSFLRIFRRPDGVTMTLSEWDYVADGGGLVLVREMLNATVGSYPAQLTLVQAPDGTTITELKWVTDRKVITLAVWERVREAADHRYNLAWMKRLAASLH